MRTEIGSEFWDAPTTEKANSLFPESTQWYLSGRSALQAIIKELKPCRSVAMPSWCCDSMVKPFADAGIAVRFYPVVWENGLVREIDQDCDVLFLMDYFGYTSPQPDLSGYSGVVIRDVTHSVFSTQYSDADYYFGSLRKWCGIWTGGYVWTKDGHLPEGPRTNNPEYITLRKRAMELKDAYIAGRRSDKKHLEVYSAAEDILETAGIAGAADRDIRIARQLDIVSLRKKRKDNAAVLGSALSDWLMFPKLKESDCPMFFPVLVPGNRRDSLRRFLIDNEIYCPVHWPVSQYHELNDRERYIYDHEISLVCDQRYSTEDMQRIADAIQQFLRS